MTFTAPAVQLNAFTCPHCRAYARFSTEWLYSNNNYRTNYVTKRCDHCSKETLWAVSKEVLVHSMPMPAIGQMIFPRTLVTPAAEPSMPEAVKRDYDEAAKVLQDSPRAAAALLRLGLQKLCKELGEKGEKINDDIRALAAKNTLPPMVIKVADTLRIAGNQAVHPGEMTDEDLDEVAAKMFDLLNFIVRKAIDEPRELTELYERIPEGPRKAAESQDAKGAGSGK